MADVSVPVYDISGEQPVQGTLAPEEVHSAISSGQYSFPKGMSVAVVDPDGNAGTIDAAEAPEAFKNGYQYQTPEIQNHIKYGSGMEQVKAGLEGFAEGVAGPIAPYLETRLGVNPEDIRGRAEEHPGTSTTGKVLGYGAGLMTGVGEGALFERAGVAGMEAAGLGLEGASVANRIGGKALAGSIEMGLLQSGDEVSKTILQDPNQSFQTAVADVGLSSILGAGGGAAFGAISPLWKATKGLALEHSLNSMAGDTLRGEVQSDMRPLVKKLLSTYGGVSEKSIDDYLVNHEAIQSAPEFAEIYTRALDHIGSINDQVEAKALSAAQAKESFQEFAQGIKDEFRQKGYEASMANTLSKQALKDAQTKLAYDVQQRALDAGPSIAGAVESLRKGVTDQSQGAYELLAESPKGITLKPFLDKSMGVADAIESEGTLEAKAQATKIRNYVQNVWDQFPGQLEISGIEAKKLIQGLDKVSTYDWNATAFDKNLSRGYKQLRHTLDDTLKSTIPEYRKAMEPLAKDVNLLKSLDRYGTEEDAIKAIKGIKNPDRFKTEIPLLKELEKKTGAKFLNEISPYADNEMRAKLMKALPQYGEAERAASRLEELKNPASRRSMEEAIHSSEAGVAHRMSQEELSVALAEKNKIKGLTPATLEGKLNTVKSGKNIEAARVLSELPGMNGKTIPEVLDLLRMKEAFEKNATRGSKHVNLYASTIGSLAGLLTGGVHGAIGGAGLGAGLGSLVDSGGPKAVKKILDAYAERFGGMAGDGGAKSGALHALAGFLKSNTNADSEAFKAGAEYVSAIERGQKMITKGTKALFKSGAEVIPTQMIDKNKIEKLDKRVEEFGAHPERLMDVGGKTAHYLPNHGAAIGETSGRVVQYLNSIRPRVEKASPLDSDLKPSKIEIAGYHRALEIAEQPLAILNAVKGATITPQDITHLKSMYPDLYTKIATGIHQEMSEHVSTEDPIPYRSRLGMSLFLSEPLDSTMTQQAIQSVQMQSMPEQPQQAQATAVKPTATGMDGLKKMTAMYQTPQQARIAAKAT